MGKSREIKDRMKAVGNIRRITKTMQMIATARFQASQRRATAAQPYTRKITQLVGELGAVGGGADHPLLQRPETPVGRQLLLVITSNRGLCGGYNANLLRQAVAFLTSGTDQQIDLEVVGKKGLAYFKFSGTSVKAFHGHLTDPPDPQAVQQLADRYMQAFTDRVYDAVRVVYMALHSVARQSPHVLSLLPMVPPAGGDGVVRSKAEVVYDFSPPPGELLNELLPIAVRNQLMQCFNEAAVGEHIARMVAMKSATDNAGKMGKELGRQYNRARQTAITTELSEIIAGSTALK